MTGKPLWVFAGSFTTRVVSLLLQLAKLRPFYMLWLRPECIVFRLIKVGERVLKRGVLLAMVMSLAACGGVDPDSPLGKRKAIFKEMLNVSEDLGGMLRGRIKYDEALFIEKAVQLDALVKTPWQHFPSIKEEEKTAARDDVWQQQERFQALARELEGTTARLVASTTQPPLNESVSALRVQAVEDACESCHKEFRAY